MNTTTSLFVVVVVIGFLAVVWFCRSEVRQRWRMLAEKGLVVTAESVDVSEIRRVITIDLGFGKETWLLTKPELSVDRMNRIVQDAVVLHRESPIPESLAVRREKASIRF